MLHRVLATTKKQWSVKNRNSSLSLLTTSRWLLVTAFLLVASWVHAQVVHFPDPNLKAVVVKASGANPDRIPVVALRRLERLDAPGREIENLEGLQYAPNIRLLDLARNSISDISPLANLHSLEELGLDRNAIKDVSPLVGLTSLRLLLLRDNQIADVEALRGLTGLRKLAIEGNFIMDRSPLDGLSLTRFTYDQVCDTPPFELESRLKSRNYPSVFAAWAGTLNQPHLSNVEKYAQHDLYISALIFDQRFFYTGETWEVRGVPGRGEQLRAEYTAINPDMVFIVSIPMKRDYLENVPEDSPYWVKGADGKPVRNLPCLVLTKSILHTPSPRR